MKDKNQGFTLIELLIVIGIIAILAAAVIVSINPGQQFEQARNTTRWNHINSLTNALYGYTVEEQGGFPDCITGEETADTDYSEVTIDGEIWYDIDYCFDEGGGDNELGDYMSAMPPEPEGGETYVGRIDDNGNVIITSTSEEFSLE